MVLPPAGTPESKDDISDNGHPQFDINFAHSVRTSKPVGDRQVSELGQDETKDLSPNIECKCPRKQLLYTHI